MTNGLLNSLKHCCNDHSCCDQYVHHTRCVLGDKKYYPAYRYFSDYGACTARYMRGEAWACAAIDAPRPATQTTTHILLAYRRWRNCWSLVRALSSLS